MKLTKKKLRGNKVSHAKNRLHRIFNPNNQSIKVWCNGKLIRISMSTSMIQRLKKDGRIGKYRLFTYSKTGKAQKPADVAKIVEKEIAKVQKTTKSLKTSKKSKETMDISSIVGKK